MCDYYKSVRLLYVLTVGVRSLKMAVTPKNVEEN